MFSVCVYVSRYMYIYILILTICVCTDCSCMQTHTHTHSHTCVSAWIQSDTHNIYMYAYVRTAHVCKHTHTHTHTHAHTHAQTFFSNPGLHSRPSITDHTFSPLVPVRSAPQPPGGDMAPNIPPRPPITKAASKDMPPAPPPKTPLKPPTQGKKYPPSVIFSEHISIVFTPSSFLLPPPPPPPNLLLSPFFSHSPLLFHLLPLPLSSLSQHRAVQRLQLRIRRGRRSRRCPMRRSFCICVSQLMSVCSPSPSLSCLIACIDMYIHVLWCSN